MGSFVLHCNEMFTYSDSRFSAHLYTVKHELAVLKCVFVFIWQAPACTGDVWRLNAGPTSVAAALHATAKWSILHPPLMSENVSLHRQLHLFSHVYSVADSKLYYRQ